VLPCSVEFRIRTLEATDAKEAAELQSLAFPPPFPQDLLWQPEHLIRHVELFPRGQFIAESAAEVVGSCSNTLVSEESWHAHRSWEETVGGPMLENFDPRGTTMYGLDITVHPAYRRLGIGRAFYEARFDLVRELGLRRYGTACRLPGFADYLSSQPESNVREYAEVVVAGHAVDRTLTPLLRYGLTYQGVIENYMDDEESGNAAALLEWLP
jgi:GNAT superfamily N-acetyltransferase